MFEQEITRLRCRLEEVGPKYGEVHFNQCATVEQIANGEKDLGVDLPEQYREFILQIGDGVRIGEEERLWLFPLFPVNNIDCWILATHKFIVLPLEP